MTALHPCFQGPALRAGAATALQPGAGAATTALQAGAAATAALHAGAGATTALQPAPWHMGEFERILDTLGRLWAPVEAPSRPQRQGSSAPSRPSGTATATATPRRPSGATWSPSTAAAATRSCG